jgi:hypothetical protein
VRRLDCGRVEVCLGKKVVVLLDRLPGRPVVLDGDFGVACVGRWLVGPLVECALCGRHGEGRKNVQTVLDDAKRCFCNEIWLPKWRRDRDDGGEVVGS